MPLKSREAYLAYQRRYAAAHRKEAVARARKWAQDNPERYKRNQRVAYVKDAEHRRAMADAYRKEHPPDLAKRRSADRRRYHANPMRFAAKRKRMYEKHADKRKASAARWRQENRAKFLLQKYRRRLAEVVANGHFTNEQWLARYEFWGSRCAYCYKKAETIDHVIPLTRGGTNWPSNLRPACRRCNSSKGNKTLAEWSEWKRAIRDAEENQR